MNTVVEMKGLVKKYGDRIVVNGVDLDILQGECFGILGPNGAGKTTTMKMIYGSVEITQGELYVRGLNTKVNRREVKNLIGVVPQEDGLDVDFTVKENLLLYASYFGINQQVARHRCEDLMRLMRLEEYQDREVLELSGGLRRRVAIGRGMINKPEVLILDEPTAGLDPQARMWIWSFLRRLKEDMNTVIMTTHYMEEAEQICDRIAIMDKGKVLTVGRPKDLIKEHIGTQVVEVEVNVNDLNYYGNRLVQSGYSYQVIGQRLTIHLKEYQNSKEVVSIVVGKKTTVREPSLSDVFLKLAGHDLREGPL